MLRLYTYFLIIWLSAGYACNAPASQEKNNGNYTVVFESMSAEHTSVTFRNDIVEDGGHNYLVYDGSYQGAGVGVGDIDNDGLTDLYFSSNQGQDKLYRNLGDFKFEDITDQAGIIDDDGWSTAVTFGDVNGDGWQDIYVSLFLWRDAQKRRNKLYINNQDGTFSEQAHSYGVDDPGLSMGATFFDYDKDGDLDLYVVNQPPNHREDRKGFRFIRDYRYTGHLYRNEDGQKFTNVTAPSGVLNFGYGLAAVASDLNNDGWTDLYLAFDYDEPDRLFYNNGDGTFTNGIDSAMAHISNFSMGVDIADINNDGWMDVFVADMVAPDHERIKTQMSGMNPERFWGLVSIGYHHQYMFNCLQVNNGVGRFSEIGQLAGVGNTDWSWAAFFLDPNLDGYQDLYVTNGIKRDVRDNDFRLAREKMIKELVAQGRVDDQGLPVVNPIAMLDLAPTTKLSNFMFANQGDFTFTNRSEEWGLGDKGWTQGAAYADLDNDGDMDIVTNNMDAPASLYRNKSSGDRHYLNVMTVSSGENHPVLNTKVIVDLGQSKQYREITTGRGYMSSCAPVAQFGLGLVTSVPTVTVVWPDNVQTVLKDVSADQTLIVDRAKTGTQPWSPEPVSGTYFTEAPAPAIRHTENTYDDYATEILIPHKMSTLGPCLAVADVNGDGLEDVYVGGARGQSSTLMLQGADGILGVIEGPWSTHAGREDISALFFDADGDGTPDLYVTSGGNEVVRGDPTYADRLYLNDGQGNYSDASSGLPPGTVSNDAIAAGDFDEDGDNDLFIGGRQWPGKWPYPVSSTMLVNDGQGNFTQSDDAIFQDYGMVTDAAWVNLDDDTGPELITVGEWMPIRVLDYVSGSWVDKTDAYGLGESRGWWNCITVVDLDADGDMDFVAGNLGKNSKYKASIDEPFKVYSADFDDNGSNDIYLGYYEHGELFPVRGRQCSSDQMPFIKEKYETYNAFADATVEEILGPSLENALVLEAQTFESSVFLNDGAGKFTRKTLPNWAQFSTIQDIITEDFNGDGYNDLLIAGNYFNREVETRRSDASIGLLLLNDGEGHFSVVHPTQSGFKAWRDARDIALLKGGKTQRVLVANNNGPLQVFVVRGKAEI